MYRPFLPRPPSSSWSFLAQELIATVDADGIVRTYRPLPSLDYTSTVDETAAASGRTSWQLVVECRLGCPSSLCEFSMEKAEALPGEMGESGGSNDGTASVHPLQ